MNTTETTSETNNVTNQSQPHVKVKVNGTKTVVTLPHVRYLPLIQQVVGNHHPSQAHGNTAALVVLPTVPPLTKKVFVVHGHDDEAKEKVARFLERLKLEPIILHEQPNEGRTVIEKFEVFADVGFAVVLLTPDDVGALASE